MAGVRELMWQATHNPQSPWDVLVRYSSRTEAARRLFRFKRQHMTVGADCFGPEAVQGKVQIRPVDKQEPCCALSSPTNSCLHVAGSFPTAAAASMNGRRRSKASCRTSRPTIWTIDSRANSISVISERGRQSQRSGSHLSARREGGRKLSRGCCGRRPRDVGLPPLLGQCRISCEQHLFSRRPLRTSLDDPRQQRSGRSAGLLSLDRPVRGAEIGRRHGIPVNDGQVSDGQPGFLQAQIHQDILARRRRIFVLR